MNSDTGYIRDPQGRQRGYRACMYHRGLRRLTPGYSRSRSSRRQLRDQARCHRVGCRVSGCQAGTVASKGRVSDISISDLIIRTSMLVGQQSTPTRRWRRAGVAAASKGKANKDRERRYNISMARLFLVYERSGGRLCSGMTIKLKLLTIRMGCPSFGDIPGT